jgi:hypothetical protein
VTVSGGTAAYTYAWTTTDGTGLVAAAEDQENLGPGTYSLTVTDSKNCPITKDFIITEPPVLNISEVISSHNGFNITCNNAKDGAIDVTVTGGTSGLYLCLDNCRWFWMGRNS